MAEVGRWLLMVGWLALDHLEGGTWDLLDVKSVLSQGPRLTALALGRSGCALKVLVVVERVRPWLLLRVKQVYLLPELLVLKRKGLCVIL